MAGTEGKTIRLRATVRQIYGGRLLLPGDPFPAPLPEHVARRLITFHFAHEDTTRQNGTLKLPRRVVVAVAEDKAHENVLTTSPTYETVVDPPTTYEATETVVDPELLPAPKPHASAKRAQHRPHAQKRHSRPRFVREDDVSY